MVFNWFCFRYEQKYKIYYHNLPQTTTLLISFTTLIHFDGQIQSKILAVIFNKTLRIVANTAIKEEKELIFLTKIHTNEAMKKFLFIDN